MAHNPKQICTECGGPTPGVRFLRCSPACADIANKAKAKARLGVRGCTRCDRPAAYRRKLCPKCQVSHDKNDHIRVRRNARNWRRRHAAESRAGRRRLYVKHRDKELKRQRAYDKAHPEKLRSKARRYKARKKPWSRFRTLRLQAEVQAAVPKHLPREVRDDAISSIILAVLEGKLDQYEIAAKAKTFISAGSRHLFDVSLDAFIPGTTIRRIDVIGAQQ